MDDAEFRKKYIDPIFTCNVIGCPNQIEPGEYMICTSCRKERGWENPNGLIEYVRHRAKKAKA